MESEKKRYYEKTVDLLLSVFQELNFGKYIRRENITDRKNRILSKEFGPTFSGNNFLLCDNFIFFAPWLVAAYDAIRCNSFEETALPDKVLKYDSIKSIQYSLMPCETYIKIYTHSGKSLNIFDGVPNAETYSDVNSYKDAVLNGTYKKRTICMLACIYALAALNQCQDTAYTDVYHSIETNIKLLLSYYHDSQDVKKKYGDFPSFDIVSCEYSENTVAIGIDKLSFAIDEAKAMQVEERTQSFEHSLERKMEETRKQYEKLKKQQSQH